jgi:hypothetical protein
LNEPKFREEHSSHLTLVANVRRKAHQVRSLLGMTTVVVPAHRKKRQCRPVSLEEGGMRYRKHTLITSPGILRLGSKMGK